MNPNNSIRAADLFCGAGGTSTGLQMAAEAMGVSLELTAINHWEVAVTTHGANHPTARHLCSDLDSVNPRELFEPGELDLLWASPECTHHSNARGGRPVCDQQRATAWCVVRWAEALRPPIVLVENVPEFQHWGPTNSQGRPIKAKQGKLFKAWIGALRAAGYRVDWRILCCADYGDPTTRRRLFIMGVRGRRRLVWPSPTHYQMERKGTPTLNFGQQPWRAAREVINWDEPGYSIFTRKRSLKPATLRRIWHGLLKYGLSNVKASSPFLVHLRGTGKSGPVESPVPVAAKGNHHGLVVPFQVILRGKSESRPMNQPVPTVSCSGAHNAIIRPFLTSQLNRENGKEYVRSVDEPLSTVTTISGEYLANPFLVIVNHSEDSRARVNAIDEPMRTVTGTLRNALAYPWLVKYYGTANGSSIDEPLNTVTAIDRFGVASPKIVKPKRVSLPDGPVIDLSGLGPETRLVAYLNMCVASKTLPVLEINGQICQLDIDFRMLQPRELARAQGFPDTYQFQGQKRERVKQIGNAVPCNTARALAMAAVSQNETIAPVEAAS